MEVDLIYLALATCFFSFGIQTLFYLWYFLRREPIVKKYKTVFSYYSGIIGDSVLMPAVNVFAVIALEKLGNPYYDFVSWFFALLVGLVTTFIFHYGQKYFDLTNWTMPQKGKWTLLGIYHSLFMFSESTFLAFSLTVYFKHLAFIGRGSFAGIPIFWGLIVMALFFTTFVYDYWQPLFKPVFFNKRVKIFRYLGISK